VKHFRIISLALVVCGGAWAQERPVNEIPIEMPVFTVTDIPELPPPEAWHYASIEGFEVLANGDEAKVRDVLHQFQRFRHALDLVWPGVSRPAVPPALLVLCGARAKFEDFLPPEQRGAERAKAGLIFRGRETSALIVDMQKKDVFGLSTVDAAANLTVDSAASAAEGATNDATGGGTPTTFQVDAYRQLFREYVKLVLAATEPRAPAWFEEGLAQLLVAMEITDTSITVGKVEDPNIAGSEMNDGDFNSAFKDKAFLRMTEMFAVERGSPEAQNAIGSVWAKQCYAFVHWGLYGNTGRNQKAFLRFLVRAGREPPSEAMFKECFGFDYAAMLRELRTHAEWTRSKTAGLRAAKGGKIPVPPPVEIRAASEAESGRIKGEAMLALGLPADARRALAIPYVRGERDPELLALLGLYEAGRGDTARARKFLDAAVRGKTRRPRAYLEFAKLLLAEERAKLAAGDKLGAAQTSAVLGPLYAARGLPPPLPESYHLMGAVWHESKVTPSAGHLAALEEGLKYSPADAELAYSAANLRKRAGMLTEARSLIDHGLKVSRDPAATAKLQSLQASLPAAPQT
jgi:hypothetical protein